MPPTTRLSCTDTEPEDAPSNPGGNFLSWGAEGLCPGIAPSTTRLSVTDSEGCDGGDGVGRVVGWVMWGGGGAGARDVSQ